ncbi:unnamed protein product [Bursaphelenchus xylophilus]|uniref:(pine wood nematode) hypothetical protein n=1 Tax=Bursaphelenchus xylophilus TaxID=6326 RepID=A0A1I7SUV7_BURXY|nr:unnamed protein product [Bursaphelenchus xylophilus]CAG9125845.1 unnamed protein product [Bursaphelenchus xylophilus]
MPEATDVASTSLIEDTRKMVAKKLPMECAVCSKETGNFNFGAQVCRACALFYKRCILEKKKYSCTNGQYDCDVKFDRSERSKCRACRFLKCKQAGVNYRLDDAASSPSSDGDADSNWINFPTIVRLMDGLKKYHAVLLEVVKRQHPDADFSNGLFIIPKKHEKITLKCVTIPDLIDILTKYFGPFAELSRNDQLKVVGDAFGEFRVLNEAYLSAYYCPQLDDNRVVFAPGYWADFCRLDKQWYLEGFLDPDEIPTFRRLIAPFGKRNRGLIKKYKQIGISLMDTVVLMVISIWKHAEYNGKLTKNMEDYKERVMKEWMESLGQRFNGKHTEKLSELMLWYQEVDRFAIEFSSVIMQVKILRAQRPHEFQYSVEDALSQLRIEE